MKLKNLFWIELFLFSFISCEEADTNYLKETELSIDIPLAAHLSGQAELSKSTSEEYYFSGISVFCLDYSNELKDCPGDIVRITPKSGASIAFEELNNSKTISKLQLVLAYKTQSDFEYKNIQTVDLLQPGSFLNGETLSVELDEILSPLIELMNENPRYFISIQITGETNFNIESDARFNIPLTIESEYHSPRFTL